MEANAKVAESFPTSNSPEPTYADALWQLLDTLEDFVYDEWQSDSCERTDDDGSMDDVALDDFREYLRDKGI